MPLYEYRCKSCGTVFEKLMPMEHIDEPTTCSYCGEYNWHEKKISLGHFFFDGPMPSYEKEARESNE